LNERLASPSLATVAGLSSAASLIIGALISLAIFVQISAPVTKQHGSKPFFLALFATASFFSLVYLAGPAWDVAQADRFESFLERVITH
jgi:hypothetical protein